MKYRKFSVTTKTGLELKLGQPVLVHLDDNGIFRGVVDHFERDNAQAVILPTHKAVQAVFPKGYTLGRAHWESQLTLLPDES